MLNNMICSDLIGFVDGELATDKAETFRNHLRTCEDCQHKLEEAVELSARISSLDSSERNEKKCGR